MLILRLTLPLNAKLDFKPDSTGERVLCEVCSKHRAARWFKASSIAGHLRSSAHRKIVEFESEREEAQRLRHLNRVRENPVNTGRLNHVHEDVPESLTETMHNDGAPAVYEHELYYDKFGDELTFNVGDVFEEEEAERTLRRDYDQYESFGWEDDTLEDTNDDIGLTNAALEARLAGLYSCWVVRITLTELKFHSGISIEAESEDNNDDTLQTLPGHDPDGDGAWYPYPNKTVRAILPVVYYIQFISSNSYSS